MNRRNNFLRELPFYGLSDAQLLWENETSKQCILDKMNNNGFIEYIENTNFYRESGSTIETHNYYDADEFNARVLKKKLFTIMHMNCRMLSKNRGKILAFFKSLDDEPHIIILTEIGREGYRFLDHVFPEYTNEYEVPEKNTYGGTAILTKRDLTDMVILPDLKMKKDCNCKSCQIENVWVDVTYGNTHYIIGAIYRHPKGDIEHFNKLLANTLEKIPNKFTCVIGGDINIDLINITHTKVLEYATELMSNGFLPKIIYPTRITDTSSTLIDHLFVRQSGQAKKDDIISGNIFAEISDHLPIFVAFNCKQTTSTNRPYTRIFSDKTIKAFKRKCTGISLYIMQNMSHIDEKFDYFHSELLEAFNESFPMVKKSRKRAKDKKWITHGIRICIRNKDRLYKKKLKSPTEYNILKFKEYKKILDSCLKCAEESYYFNIFNDNKKSAINMWKTLGSIINPGKKKKIHKINQLKVGNNVIRDNAAISNAMNNHFCTVGSKLATDLPQGNSYNIYLKNKVNQTIYLTPITDVEVANEISRLGIKKSPGYDNISPRILKACGDELTKPLTILFNYSIETATYPSKLKISKVIALHKKKSQYLPDNYRPISLLSCIDKIFEKLLHKRFIKFIEQHKIIILEQYGFLKYHSTVLALIESIDNIRKLIENGEYVLAIYLDLKKAFDTVDHNILLGKLEHYGIRGHANKLIRSYLSNRIQYTTVNGINSDKQEITMGVPQGSVLGPLFFLIYVNDIVNVLKHEKTTLFADDTSVLINDKNIERLKQKSEESLKNIYEWLLSNRLSLSWEKTFFVVFHSPKKRRNFFNELKVYDFTIKRVTCVKYLGMYIDENLKWDKHVNNLCNLLTKNFHMFYSIRNLLPDKLKKQLYFSLVYSRILYGIELYGACRATLLNRVQILQNKLLKVLYKLPYRTSTNDMHYKLKVLKVEDIYKSRILKFVYESINGLSIIQFQNHYHHYNNTHHHYTRNRNILYAPRTKTKYGESTLKYKGCIFWNELRKKNQKCKSLYTFKKAIRHFLIDVYCNQ